MEFNGTFLATIITFILFIFVMNKILYAPILGIMEERQNFIDSNYKDAQENKNKIEVLKAHKEAKLVEAKDRARVKYVETIDEYKSQKEDFIKDTQYTINQKLDSSKEELIGVSNEVKESLKGSMNDLANDIVERVIGYRSEIEGFDDAKVSEVLWGQNS